MLPISVQTHVRACAALSCTAHPEALSNLGILKSSRLLAQGSPGRLGLPHALRTGWCVPLGRQPLMPLRGNLLRIVVVRALL